MIVVLSKWNNDLITIYSFVQIRLADEIEWNRDDDLHLNGEIGLFVLIAC